MKHYKIWQAPIFGFFSTQFYRELGSSAKGVFFLYLLVYIAVTSLVTPIKQFVAIQTLMVDHGLEIVKQMPDLKIENGQLSIDRACPYYVEDPMTTERFVAFDTTNQFHEPSELQTRVLVTADGIYARTDRGDFERKFTGIKSFHCTPAELLHLMTLVMYLVPTLAYLIAIPFNWVSCIVQALGFSLAGLILAKSIGVQIKYEGILRITCVALGNVLLLDAIMQIFPLEIPGYGLMEIAIPYWFLYKFVLTLGFTLFGVGANLAPPTFEPLGETVEAELPQR